MKVKEVFEKSIQFLREKNIETPRLEAELLIAFVLKTDRVGIYLKYEAPLTELEITTLRNLVVRKSKGEPTAYLIGEKYFFGNRLEVGPGVLIPRPETELIVENLLSSDLSDFKTEELRIADFGSGSGCLGLSIGKSIANSKLSLIEKSSTAIKYCEKNLELLFNSEEKKRFELLNIDVINWSPKEQFHIIVANPPYIDTKDTDVSPMVVKYEPAEALFAPKEGLADIINWIALVEKNLLANGIVYFEIGRTQGAKVLELFKSKNIFKKIEILQDFSKMDRIVKAVKNG